MSRTSRLYLTFSWSLWLFSSFCVISKIPWYKLSRRVCTGHFTTTQNSRKFFVQLRKNSESKFFAIIHFAVWIDRIDQIDECQRIEQQIGRRAKWCYGFWCEPRSHSITSSTSKHNRKRCNYKYKQHEPPKRLQK